MTEQNDRKARRGQRCAKGLLAGTPTAAAAVAIVKTIESNQNDNRNFGIIWAWISLTI